MQPFKGTKSKTSYFTSPKKEPLVRKMIFDPHESIPPASCFDLRPMVQNESNQQEIIFEQKSSSMKEISDFEKSSPHEFDKIIYGLSQQNAHNQHIFLNTDRSHISSNEVEKEHDANEDYSQNSNSLKREASLSPEEAKKYENVVKIFQISDQPDQTKQKFQRITYGMNNFKRNLKLPERYETEFPGKQVRKRNFKSKQKLNQIEDNVKLQEQDIQKVENALVWPGQQIQKTVKVEKIWAEKEQFTPQSNKRKVMRKFADNTEFQLINQFTELMSYSSLIEDMITVYDRSPLFETPLDFDSQPEETNEEQNPNNSSRNSFAQQQVMNQQSSSRQVKIQDISMELQGLKFDSDASLPQKNEKEYFSTLDKRRIDEAPNKNKKMVMKEIRFQRTKTYLNFYEAIHEMKPYVKKMSLEEKNLFLAFKKELKQTKDIIEYFEKRKNSQKREHICKICGQQFESGRQLGGHMSRKHPGKALEYVFKKELHKVKEIERNRRKYFKTPKKNVKNEEQQDMI